jgi:putative oxidoreductase
MTMDLGLLLLRVVLGVLLAAHGAQKLFGWFGGYGLAGTGGFLESIGFRPGKLQAFVAGSAELGGGLLLALGLATPLAAVLLVAVMLVATVSVHWAKGLFVTNGGYEYNLVIGVAALALAFTGPGAYSVDAVVGLDATGVTVGLAAGIAGLLGGTGALLGRSFPKTAEAATRT